MKRLPEICSALVFLAPLPFLLREPYLYAAWSLVEFLSSLTLSRLLATGRLERRGRAQAELVLRALCLPLTVLLFESGGLHTTAGLLRFALTCALLGQFRLRWLWLFLVLFAAGSLSFSFFYTWPDLPFHQVLPLFACLVSGALAGLAAASSGRSFVLLRRARRLAARTESAFAAYRSTAREIFSAAVGPEDVRVFERGGMTASREFSGILFSVYLREFEKPGLERLESSVFDREWEQYLGRLFAAAQRSGFSVFPAGGCLRFVLNEQGAQAEANAVKAAGEMLAFCEKTWRHHSANNRLWPRAAGFLSSCVMRQVSAGPRFPARLLLSEAVSRQDQAFAEAAALPDPSAFFSVLPLLDESMPAASRVDIAGARSAGRFILPGAPFAS